MAQIEMPRYKSHKTVWALKIAEVRAPNLPPDTESDGSLLIVPEDTRYAPFVVDYAYVRKHAPQAGGYYVVYEDGYASWSPAGAFEAGHTLVSGPFESPGPGAPAAPETV